MQETWPAFPGCIWIFNIFSNWLSCSTCQSNICACVRACMRACVRALVDQEHCESPDPKHFQSLFLGHKIYKRETGSAGRSLKKNRTKHFLPVKTSCVLLVTKINDCTSTSMQGVIGGKALTASASSRIRTNQNISGHKSAAGQEVRSSFKASGETMRAFHSCATLIPSKLCVTALNPVSCCGSEPGGGKAKALAACWITL